MWSVGAVERTDGWDKSILKMVRTVLTRPFPKLKRSKYKLKSLNIKEEKTSRVIV